MTSLELDVLVWRIEEKLTEWKYDVKLSGKEEEALQDLFREYEQLARKLLLLTNKPQ